MLTIFLIMVSSMVQYQNKHDYCEKIDFKGSYCATPKKLEVVGGK